MQSPPKQQPQQEEDMQSLHEDEQPPQKEKQARKPLSKDELLIYIWIKHDPKYKPSVPMLLEAELEAAKPNCQVARLHDGHSKDKLVFPANVAQDYS
jgi:hypothetical protein